jgi:glyoxylase-like metal-dependent hydrolase (beta-lactamase superfamily II)
MAGCLIALAVLVGACGVDQSTSNGGQGLATRSVAAAATTFSGAVSPNVSRRIDLAPDLYLRQIGDRAYVITNAFTWEGVTWPGNSLLVQMADGTLVLAGTPWTPEATQEVLGWAKLQFGESSIAKMVAVDTGYHQDNLGGNAALLAAGVPVYGSDLTVRLLAERGGSGIPPPDHVFPIAAGLTLSFGNEEVRVIFPGPSQAPDKLAAYFPARKLLFGSCMILSGDAVGNTADADMAAWPTAIRKLQGLAVDVVVPGHGDRLDPGLIQHTLDVLSQTNSGSGATKR